MMHVCAFGHLGNCACQNNSDQYRFLKQLAIIIQQPTIYYNYLSARACPLSPLFDPNHPILWYSSQVCIMPDLVPEMSDTDMNVMDDSG